MGEPLLSKITLYGLPPPPRLSMKMGSGSGLLLVVMLIQGKSLGTETPLGMMPATPTEAVVASLASGCGATVRESWEGGVGTVTERAAAPGKCPEKTN